MEVSLCVKARKLRPLILSHIIDFTLVHRFIWQGRPDCKYLTLLSLNEYARESVSSPLEKHVSPLNKPLFDKFIAKLGCFAWFATSGQEYAPLFILNRHKVGGNLDVHHVRPIAMRSEIVHKQVVCVVNEEM